MERRGAHLNYLLPGPPPRWRGVLIALAALALFLGAALAIWAYQTENDEPAAPVVVRQAK